MDTSTYTLRFRDPWRKQLEEEARRVGMPLSKFLRIAILYGAPEVAKLDRVRRAIEIERN